MSVTKPAVGGLARIHPGEVIHSMDHYVMDIKDEASGTAAYLTLYSLGYMPEVGTGHCCFLRVRTADGGGDVDLALSETPEIGEAMQRRLRGILATAGVSRGIGIDLDVAPRQATFHRAAGSATFGYRVVAADHEIEASWLEPATPIWVAAPRGSFHHERDIASTMISFWGAELTVDGVAVSGRPYEDDVWEKRLGRLFSSTHLALGETALSPGGSWWR